MGGGVRNGGKERYGMVNRGSRETAREGGVIHEKKNKNKKKSGEMEILTFCR